MKLVIAKPRFDLRNWARMLACASVGGAIAAMIVATLGGSAHPYTFVDQLLGSLVAGLVLGGGGALLRFSVLARVLAAAPLLWLIVGPIYIVFTWPGLKLGELLGFYSITLAEVHITP